MITIVVDAILLEKLNHLREPLELRDASGKLLAKVVPTPLVGEISFDAPPPLSPEERERRLNGKFYPLQEILARLEKLPCSA